MNNDRVTAFWSLKLSSCEQPELNFIPIHAYYPLITLHLWRRKKRKVQNFCYYVQLSRFEKISLNHIWRTKRSKTICTYNQKVCLTEHASITTQSTNLVTSFRLLTVATTARAIIPSTHARDVCAYHVSIFQLRESANFDSSRRHRGIFGFSNLIQSDGLGVFFIKYMLVHELMIIMTTHLTFYIFLTSNNIRVRNLCLQRYFCQYGILSIIKYRTLVVFCRKTY